MIKLDAGNVLLKPAQRRQLMAWLKRACHLGKRLGDFVLHITVRRSGRFYNVLANVHDRAGDFRCRMRRHELQQALREMARRVSVGLHDQMLARSVAV
jgi:hypothetical protein